VSFLIVEGPRNALLVDKAEDPAWVITNGIKIDYNYYYTNQMRNPVCDFLEPLVGKNPEQVIFPTSKSIKDFFPLKT
jgi:DNA polymerase delta subunit 1